MIVLFRENRISETVNEDRKFLARLRREIFKVLNGIAGLLKYL